MRRLITHLISLNNKENKAFTKSKQAVNNNYLQLLYREVKGILLYQGFRRTILLTYTSRAQRGIFCRQIGRVNPNVKKNFNLPKK